MTDSETRSSSVGARVSEIDLLRFIAATAVVLYHLAFRGHAADERTEFGYVWLVPVAKYGYLGVDLFFMISGFVILMTASSGSLHKFIVSRLVRLYPAFWACCTITFAVILVFGAPRYSASGSQWLVNMTMLAEFVGVAPIDGVYWSLYVEIKFYVLMGIILWLGLLRHVELILIGWLVIAAVMAVAPVYKITYWLATDWTAYFVAGAMFFQVWRNGSNRTRWLTIMAAWLLAIQQALRHVPELEGAYSTDLEESLVAMIITGCFAVVASIALRRTGRLARMNWLTVGSLTYPLYLIHQNIGYIAFNQLHRQSNPHLLFWGVVASCVALAWVVQRWVERPVSTGMKRVLSAGMLRQPIRR